MRILLDENCGSRSLAERLRGEGHDVTRVVDVGLLGMPDTTVLRFATEDGRVLLSRDTAHGDTDDLTTVWTAAPKPKPILLLIYPGTRICNEDIVRAVERIDAAGDAIDGTIQIVNHWK